MSDFVNFVGGYLVRAAAGAALVAAFGALILWAAAKHHKKKYGAEQPFPWARSVLLLLLAGYLAAVLFVTVRGSGYYTGSANFHLFRAWREAWNSFSERAWLNVLLNIAMFVPLGILLPLLWEKLQKGYLMLIAGLGTSLFIELSQLLKGSGLFDVDDLFTNTLGAVIGFWMLMAVLRLWKHQWGRGVGNLLALLAVAAAIGSIFVVYDAQEYGNLPSHLPSFPGQHQECPMGNFLRPAGRNLGGGYLPHGSLEPGEMRSLRPGFLQKARCRSGRCDHL